MILMSIIFLLIIVVVLLLYKLYQFSIFILEIEDSIEESIDILNEMYVSINKILQKEIFFDSVEVRQVLADIRASQDAIVEVANKITKNIKTENINETEEKNKKPEKA